MRDHNIKPFIWFSCLGIILLLLAAPLDNYLYDFSSQKGIAGEDILYRVMGEARKVFSASSIVTADIYFHGGFYPSDYKRLHLTEQLGKDHGHEGEHVHDEYCHHLDRDTGSRKDDEITRVSPYNGLLYLGEKINISKHIHLHGGEEKEMLPWLYYAVRLDPQNVNAYVIGGHWLGRRLKKPDEAIQLLQEGIANNPDSWRIYEEMGMIYFTALEDYETALQCLLKAKQLQDTDNSDDLDRDQTSVFIVGCREKLGQK